MSDQSSGPGSRRNFLRLRNQGDGSDSGTHSTSAAPIVSAGETGITSVETAAAGMFSAHLGRRSLFQAAAAALASAGFPEISSKGIPARSALERLTRSKLKGILPFMDKGGAVQKIVTIPGSNQVLKNLLGAESALFDLTRLAKNVCDGTRLEDDTPSSSDLIGSFGSHVAHFKAAGAELSDTTRAEMAHALAWAERIQDQIDAWEVILRSPLRDQVAIAQSEHKRMTDALDVCLEELGINDEDWKKMTNDGFGTRILFSFFQNGMKGISGVINSEFGSTEVSILKDLTERAAFHAKGKSPKHNAEFFRRAKEMLGGIRSDTTEDGESLVHKIEQTATGFFEKHPELKPKDETEKPSTAKAGQKEAEPDLTAAHDELVMKNPEMAYWLIRARVEQGQKKLGEKKDEVTDGTRTGRS